MFLLYEIFFFFLELELLEWNVSVPYDFWNQLLFRAAAPACNFSTTNAASCFHDLLIGIISVL